MVIILHEFYPMKSEVDCDCMYLKTLSLYFITIKYEVQQIFYLPCRLPVSMARGKQPPAATTQRRPLLILEVISLIYLSDVLCNCCSQQPLISIFITASRNSTNKSVSLDSNNNNVITWKCRILTTYYFCLQKPLAAILSRSNHTLVQ